MAHGRAILQVMAVARLSGGLALGLAVVPGASLGGCTCGEGSSDPQALPSAPPEPAAAVVTAEADGDALLARARQGIRDGALPAELQAEVLGSSAPEHARARRVLQAMVAPPVEAGDAGPQPPSEDARTAAPPILPPSDPSSVTSPPEPEPDRGGGSTAKAGEPSPEREPASARRPSRPRGDASLGTLALRSSAQGATLTIAAPSSLVVGVANQPASGLVRLVIESAKAGDVVLRARPRVDGAEVTGVRQGQGTVQITLRLDPGWTLGSVQPFSGGAKVHLRAPP